MDAGRRGTNKYRRIRTESLAAHPLHGLDFGGTPLCLAYIRSCDSDAVPVVSRRQRSPLLWRSAAVRFRHRMPCPSLGESHIEPPGAFLYVSLDRRSGIENGEDSAELSLRVHRNACYTKRLYPVIAVD